MIKLYPHQQNLVDRNPACHLLAFDKGVGKTVTALALSEKNCKTCLVICPKMQKPMWERETKKYGEKCNYSVMTKEEFKKEMLVLPGFDGVIFDEAHVAAGEKSQLSKGFHRWLKKRDIKYRWLLTATPILSSAMSVYVLARHLGHEIEYWEFRRKYFYEVKMGFRTIPKPKPGMEKELAKFVREIGTVVDMEEAVAQAKGKDVGSLPELSEIPEQEFITEHFELTKEQKDAIAKLDDPTFITRFTHQNCIENGLLYSDGYTEDQVFPCLKTERIVELVKDNKKIAVFARYNKQLSYLKEEIENNTKDRKVYILQGDTKDRDGMVTEADNDPTAIILIQSDCAVGYELPSFHTIVFASLSFSYVSYSQSLGRFVRINRLDHPKKYIHLVSKGVDLDIYNCIMRKEDFYVELFYKKKYNV